ncbi:hypothetical protein B296_00051165, partial [Ensete ventricosum]
WDGAAGDDDGRRKSIPAAVPASTDAAAEDDDDERPRPSCVPSHGLWLRSAGVRATASSPWGAMHHLQRRESQQLLHNVMAAKRALRFFLSVKRRTAPKRVHSSPLLPRICFLFSWIWV